MKNKRRLTIIINRLFLICLIIWLVGCVPVTPAPGVDIPFSCESREAPKNDQASNGFFIDNQVIVTGPEARVDEIVGPHNLTLVEDCDLSYLGTLDPPENVTTPPIFEGKESTDSSFSNEQLDNDAPGNRLVMRLYEIPDGQAFAEDVIQQVNDTGNEQSVYSVPNYLTGSLQNNGSCGDPYSGGGSPYSGGGSPYASAGIPNPGSNVSQEFKDQWALGPLGIELPASGTGTGDGIRIGVFDTAPFGSLTAVAQPITFSLSPTSAQLSLWVTDAIVVPLNLTSHSAQNINDHGLFVAGLINTIAPSSEIHLIRVLNDDGCGDLMTISTAIHDFTSRMSSNGRGQRLDKVVINLSLGVHQPDEQRLQENENLIGKLPTEIVALKEAIREAHRRGAIIVAASGNDSAGVSAQPMQLPARYDKVIGVAASNMIGYRSCYSNVGDVAAPGGDGGTDDNGNGCAPRAGTWKNPPDPCADMASCDYGLISLSETLSQTATGAPGFIFWVGTSFSTPLVTGLAAQTLEKTNGDREQAVCFVLEGSLPGASELGRGIINVTNSINLTTCP